MDAIEAAGAHPEEFRATWDMKVGDRITMHGTARCTPVGLVTAGIAASAILLSAALLTRALRGR